MATGAYQSTKRARSRSRGAVAAALLLAAALLVLLLVRYCSPGAEHPAEGDAGARGGTGGVMSGDSLMHGDTTALRDSVVEAGTPMDTTAGATPGTVAPGGESGRQSGSRSRDSLAGERRHDHGAQDTARGVARADTSAADTVSADTIADPCVLDTVTPWIYPDPSGGLHRGPISITFASSEPAAIEWRFEDEDEWVSYTGGSVDVTMTLTLHYRGCDSCGNCMEPRSEFFEIKPLEVSRFCPPDMEYVEVGSARFCIDRYEWPNRKGTKPVSFVTIYAAMDSCYVARKRLCTTEEWSLACAGAYGWEYPYGGVYEANACVTRDTTVRKSGSRAECRGYFAVFDMAGNLAEWTSTRSRSNANFYNVMGGFWESGPQSTCFGKRYSYFPENRHNPVGFRCCKDAVD